MVIVNVSMENEPYCDPNRLDLYEVIVFLVLSLIEKETLSVKRESITEGKVSILYYR